MKSHTQHLRDFLGRDGDLVLVESDPEGDRRRYDVDGTLYDVETATVRNADTGELEQARQVAVVLPIDEHAVELDGANVCPTCGRVRARAHRRYNVTDAQHAAAVIEEHGV